jgi:hypothetical protein
VLDAFIIEQLRKRERQHDDSRPQIELPLPADDERQEREPSSRKEPKEEGERGVVIIDFGS